MIAQQLPWMLFALPAGALVDRVDRRLAMTAACVVRSAALGGLALAILTAHAGMPLLYAVFFLVGSAGLGYENAATAVLPAIVARPGLERANGQLQSAATFSRGLIARPLGAWLFTLAAWVPFGLDAAGLAVVTALSAALPATVNMGAARTSRAGMRSAMGEGMGWLLRHRLLRALAATVGISNLGLGAVFSVFVLIARVRLGTGPVGYSLLLVAIAGGGIAGGLAAPLVVTAIGAGRALRLEFTVEVLTYLGLALTPNVIVAAVLLALLSLHLVIFSTIGASLRQSLTPPGMLGRVHGAYRVVSNGGMLIGAALGGVLSRYIGLTAPFWLGLALMTAAAACAWGRFSNQEIVAARTATPAD
jgi:predicted MFS family arabinose efflux permease